MKRQLMLFAMLALAGLVVLLLSPSVMPASSSIDMTVISQNDDDDDGNGIPENIIRRGFAIAPVPLDLRHRNRALVGLGSYIVNAPGGCNGCHTNPSFLPGHDPFMGEPEHRNTSTPLATFPEDNNSARSEAVTSHQTHRDCLLG
ncbi:MAG: hypothetical protein M3Q91_14755 [Acidobacteriota bacterium]|nr:hypothetical protein [Acidobacteriota bacterium]